MSSYTTQYEFELEIDGSITAGIPAVLHLAPDMCREGEAPEVEVRRVFIIDGNNRFEVESPSDGLVQMCIETILQQSAEDMGGGSVF